MPRTLAATVAIALLTFGSDPAAAQVPPVPMIDDEDPDEVVAPPAPAPVLPAPRVRPSPAPVPVVPAPAPPTAPHPTATVAVYCTEPPCPIAPAPTPGDLRASAARAPVPVTIVPGPLDRNFRKVYKLGLGLEILGPAYTLGLSGNWNVSHTFGLSATFGFVGPQVLTLQARLMPLDGKWTPYVAGGVSFLLNPGWGEHESYSSCAAPAYGSAGYSCTDTYSSKTGDDFIFKDTNIVPSVEVGVMVLTHRGFSAQLGFTFYINGSYKDEFGILTVPWPKVGLAWYF
jgi:hypothetical protein